MALKRLARVELSSLVDGSFFVRELSDNDFHFRMLPDDPERPYEPSNICQVVLTTTKRVRKFAVFVPDFKDKFIQVQALLLSERRIIH